MKKIKEIPGAVYMESDSGLLIGEVYGGTNFNQHAFLTSYFIPNMEDRKRVIAIYVARDKIELGGDMKKPLVIGPYYQIVKGDKKAEITVISRLNLAISGQFPNNPQLIMQELGLSNSPKSDTGEINRALIEDLELFLSRFDKLFTERIDIFMKGVKVVKA